MKQYIKGMTPAIKEAFAAMVVDVKSQPTILGKLVACQRGGMNIGGIMMLGIAMVFVAIGFIFLPITTDAAEDILDWIATCNTSITDATFTGFTSVVGITPLLILVGYLVAAVISGMMGVKAFKGGYSGGTNPGALMLLGMSIIFIGIGLIIEPVMLEGVATVLSNNSGVANTGQGISSTFTGYSAVLLISPMLIHIGFLAAAVLSGFFGLKKLGGGSED